MTFNYLLILSIPNPLLIFRKFYLMFVLLLLHLLLFLSFDFIFFDVIGQDPSAKFQQLHSFLTSVLSQLSEKITNSL